MSTIETNKQLTREFFKAMQSADAEAIANAYADDGRLHTMGNTAISGVFTREQIKAFAGSVLDAFPQGLQFTITQMTAEEDRVAVEASSEGVHVTGMPYKNYYHFLFTWRDGKLQELKEYMDTEVVTQVICQGQRPA